MCTVALYWYSKVLLSVGVALVLLVVALMYCPHRAIAGGTLDFVPLYYNAYYGFGERSDFAISTNGGFKFASTTVFDVYVSTNGYISMGEPPNSDTLSFPFSSPVVAPYAAASDFHINGQIFYEHFEGYSPSMIMVSAFIHSETGENFNGTKMIVAEWNHVSKFSGYRAITNTFQGILITDGSSSYAVFIYECGGMDWGGGVIGWQAIANSSLFEEHFLSDKPNSDVIGCWYSNSYSAIVYRLDTPIEPRCGSDNFTCENGECISQSDVCNQRDDCADASDEAGCDGCDDNEFTCGSGECIPQSLKCDLYIDCSDGSDEECDCVESVHHYICHRSDICIHEFGRCNGRNDCGEGDPSDEARCDFDSTPIIVVVSTIITHICFCIVISTCLCMCYCIRTYKKRTRHDHPVLTLELNRTALMSSSQTTSESSAAPSNQVTSSIASPYPQQPIHNDATLHYENDPPSSTDATSLPFFDAQQSTDHEEYSQQEHDPVVACPPHQKTVLSPQDVSHPNQTTTPTQSLSQCGY